LVIIYKYTNNARIHERQQLAGVIHLIWLSVSTVDGHLQASSLKYKERKCVKFY